MRKMRRLYAIWIKFESSQYHRIMQIVAIGFTFGLIGWTLIIEIEEANLRHLHFDPSALLISLALTTGAFYLGTFSWVVIVHALNPQTTYSRAIEYHLWSVVAKYLPSMGLQQISKGVQLYLDGEAGKQIILLPTLEIALIILTGLTTAFQAHSLSQRNVLGLEPTSQSAIVIVLWVVCGFVPVAVSELVSKGRVSRVKHRELIFLYIAELLDIIAWLTLGLTLWFIVRSILPLPLEMLPDCITILSLSIVAGLAVVIAPNGYGIRELTMSILLQSILSAYPAIIVALMSRIIFVAAEFLGLLSLLFIVWRRGKQV